MWNRWISVNRIDIDAADLRGFPHTGPLSQNADVSAASGKGTLRPQFFQWVKMAQCKTADNQRYAPGQRKRGPDAAVWLASP